MNKLVRKLMKDSTMITKSMGIFCLVLGGVSESV